MADLIELLEAFSTDTLLGFGVEHEVEFMDAGNADLGSIGKFESRLTSSHIGAETFIEFVARHTSTA